MPEPGFERHPLALRSPALLAAFRCYVRCFAWMRFSAVRVSRGGLPAPFSGRPLVIYSNHPSWWDPAIFMIAGPKFFPGRLEFGPMAAAELRKWGFFRRLGVFGLEPGRRGAAQFLRVARQGLADPRAALWITAEGAFTDARKRPLHLQPGVAHLARDVRDVVLLPLALDYVFWNESRPEVLLRFGEPIAGAPGIPVAEWRGRLTGALTEAMDGLAQDSAARDPLRFMTLIPGATQTGLLFQKTRRAAAAS